jgi:hypothetical protein
MRVPSTKLWSSIEPMDGIEQVRKAGEGPPSPSPPETRAKSGSAYTISAAESTAIQSRIRYMPLKKPP